MHHREHRKALKAAMRHLSRHDPKLAPLIARIGEPTFMPHTDYYWELVDAIISQQLSIKAAHTIEQRFLALFGGNVPEPKQLIKTSVADLRAVGMSNAKAAYVLDLAGRVNDGRLDIARLPHLPNQEIITELTAVKGIGEWTAQMFLIFALGRLDVLPVGDLGFKNGAQKLYGLTELPQATALQKIAATNHWHPYESVATWYIWQSLSEPTRQA
ncbi:MAG TPA: DNA-3-methyladenine glycosylase [Magnetospirillaceae bacterium]|nr:DNA-3-methyladenine glycosylase [Magnetospirillaceae bacterium]